jgi:hypothetical protein
MFRRIEQIAEFKLSKDGEETEPRNFLTGLIGYSAEAVIDAWCDMPCPRTAIPRNCRFYFTETGWKKYGRATVAACQKSGTKYRVLAIKENALDIVYQDEYQVAGQPKRKWRKDKARLSRSAFEPDL